MTVRPAALATTCETSESASRGGRLRAVDANRAVAQEQPPAGTG